MLIHEELTNAIIGAAIEVHKELGPGLLESVYEHCLCRELSIHGICFQRQVDLPVCYKGISLACGYKMDIVVAESVIVEVESVGTIDPIHEAQLLTYLRLTQMKVGLLINFNVAVLKDGIRRRVF
ncbi:MAG: GxxExxY protein [Planctomycetaceae bacterium]